MISHKYKFLSIRIPKTASTAVTFALNEYLDIHGCSDENSPYRYHKPHLSLKSISIHKIGTSMSILNLHL